MVPKRWSPQCDLFVPGSSLDAMTAPIDQVAVTIHNGLTPTIRELTDLAEHLPITASFGERSSPYFELERTIYGRLFERTHAPVSHFLVAQRICTIADGWRVFSVFAHLTHLGRLILAPSSTSCATRAVWLSAIPSSSHVGKS
ncbi:hypothetical protein GSI_04501 [Ganoderma sinense ZZ0214-1]|uniref:Uncharacterized protein n=1 Tax=Ganoderma sinense ZZ0214-1 TaxID=1077348 RepID=A0A2G8SH12_9APHY|nr:hypothetical protein GSI_04501 [Ganoderma sinense ZZ0214-1]